MTIVSRHPWAYWIAKDLEEARQFLAHSKGTGWLRGKVHWWLSAVEKIEHAEKLLACENGEYPDAP